MTPEHRDLLTTPAVGQPTCDGPADWVVSYVARATGAETKRTSRRCRRHADDEARRWNAEHGARRVVTARVEPEDGTP